MNTLNDTLRTIAEGISREDALVLNRKNCTAPMNFTPYDGKCWSCGADLVSHYGRVQVASGLNITGCPRCHRSYCE